MRQLALLHFRNAITLSVKLEDALARTRARVPPAVVQMLLVLQVGGAFPRIWVHVTYQWLGGRRRLIRRNLEGGGSCRGREGAR